MDEKLKQEIVELIKSLDNKDSIEIGNSKTGVVKVYGDFSRPEEFELKIKKGIEFLKTHRVGVLE